MIEEKLKLYVWEDILTDSTSGIAFALATSVEHARDVIMQSDGETSYATAKHRGALWNDISGEPDIYEDAIGFSVWGGA